MKNILFIAGVGAAAYAVYLLYSKKDTKDANGNTSPSLIKLPKNVQLYPEEARREFDTKWDALFPSRRAGGSTILSADSIDTFQG